MPARTEQQLRERESGLKGKLADKAGSLTPAERRRTRKRLRRAQRRRRGIAARKAPAAKAAAPAE